MPDMKTGFAKGRLAAVLAAAGFAGVVMLAALPLGFNTSVLQQSVVYAEAGDVATTGRPVRLFAPIHLGKGARIEVSEHVAASDTASTHNDGSATAPHLTIKNANLIIDQSPETRAEPAIAAGKTGQTSQIGRLIRSVVELQFQELSFVDTMVKLRRPGGSVKPIATINVRLKPGTPNKKNLTFEGSTTYEDRVLIINARVDLASESATTIPIEADIDGTDFKLSLSGKLATNSGLRFIADTAHFQTSDLKSVLDWLGMGPIKSAGLQEFQAKGRLEWTETSFAFEQSTFALDGNSATGRLSFFFDARRPSVEGTLAFDSLDLKRYLAASRDGDPNDGLLAAWTNFQNTIAENELPLGLKHIDADLRLSTKALRYDGNELGQVAGVVVAKDGHMKADIADMRLASGTIGRANIGIDVNGFVPSYVVRGDLSHLDLASASQSLSASARFDGLANLTFDVKGHGKSLDKILRTISGQIMMTAPDGVSLPFDLSKVFAKPKRGTITAWGDVGSGYTALENATLQMTARNGVLKTKVARAQFDDQTINASGTFRLRDMMLNLVLARLDSQSQEAPKATDDSVQLRGPFGSPEIKFLSGSDKS